MDDVTSLRGFDSYVVTLGDKLRGERITLNRTVEQVASDLRIKSSYILAIENGDLGAFELPVLVGGLVRSYARYLDLDPEETYQQFCRETGFSSQVVDPFAATNSKSSEPIVVANRPAVSSNRDSLVNRSSLTLGFIRPRQFWHDFSVSAVVNMAILVLIIAGVAYGGWKVVHEIQQLRTIPVEEARAGNGDLITSLWLLTSEDGSGVPDPGVDVLSDFVGESGDQSSASGLGRSHRPQILDFPVVEPRDGPIAAIDPDSFGTLVQVEEVPVIAPVEPPQVVEKPPPVVEVYAANPAWLRVFVDSGDVLFEEILDAKQRYEVPQDIENPLLRSGNSGSVYLIVDGTTYGPVGTGTGVAKRVSLNAKDIVENYQYAEITVDENRRTAAVGTIERTVLPD